MNQLEAPPAPVGPRQRRQFLLITVGAVAIYVTMRLLPTGTNLNHADFQVQARNSIEFCDVHNPQFIPVVAVKSPVTTTLATAEAAVAGGRVDGTLTFRTFSGKPIEPRDLLEVHTKLMHLMIVDPSLTDYQHVHPEPTKTPGEWTFSFSPRFGGTYRLFADFTPVATGRGLYANTDLAVSGSGASAAAIAAGEASVLGKPAECDGYRFELTAADMPIRARQVADLTLRVVAPDGGRVPLQPIMGAYAHLVAFDAQRTGFAHLHPDQADPLTPPDGVHPALKFKVSIPNPGRYVIWTQTNLAGREVFVPFWFDVGAAD